MGWWLLRKVFLIGIEIIVLGFSRRVECKAAAGLGGMVGVYQHSDSIHRSIGKVGAVFHSQMNHFSQ